MQFWAKKHYLTTLISLLCAVTQAIFDLSIALIHFVNRLRIIIRYDPRFFLEIFWYRLRNGNVIIMFIEMCV